MYVAAPPFFQILIIEYFMLSGPCCKIACLACLLQVHLPLQFVLRLTRTAGINGLAGLTSLCLSKIKNY